MSGPFCGGLISEYVRRQTTS